MKVISIGITLVLLSCATARSQEIALDTEQLAARALSITVGVEVTGTTTNPAVSQTYVPSLGPGANGYVPGVSVAPAATDQVGTLNYIYNVVNTEQAKVQVASGTIVGDGSLVITAAVRAEPSDTVRITLPDGRITKGQLIARDGTGLISICRVEGFQGPQVAISEQDVRVGQRVMSAQCVGEGDFAVRIGIVSAAERLVKEDMGPWIQIDIPADVGSAGGPVLNERGEVAGIVVATKNEAASLSFALPGREITRLLNQIIQEESQRQGLIVANRANAWLGVKLRSEEQQPLKIDVLNDSPAAKSGLQSGDRLLEIDSHPVNTPAQVQRLLRRYNVGDQIVVKIQRADNPVADITVQLGEIPKQDVTLSQTIDPALNSFNLYFQRVPVNNNLIITAPDPNQPDAQLLLSQNGNLVLNENYLRWSNERLAAPGLTLSRSDQDQKLEQLSSQLSEIAKQLGALADEVKKLRENNNQAAQPESQPAPSQPPATQPQQ
jgi:S1-C subfamily serine protease/outer membrane murein-binding lipoprotein Lpp